MKTGAFEAELRQALAHRAAEVPAEAADRLRRKNYRPRSHSRAGVATAGLAAAVLAASGGAYLAGTTAGPASPSHASADMPGLRGATITLAGYQFSLPAGFKTTTAPCIAHIPGDAHAMPVAASRWFAAGAAAHGGCAEAVLSTASLTPPRSATPLRIGRYQGYLLAQPRHRITLYIDLPMTSGHRWLVIAARHLSQLQVSEMASRALDQPIGTPRK